MFFRKQERKHINPWCVLLVGGLATVGAISIVNTGKEFIKEKGSAMMSLFKCKSSTGCGCDKAETL